MSFTRSHITGSSGFRISTFERWGTPSPKGREFTFKAAESQKENSSRLNPFLNWRLEPLSIEPSQTASPNPTLGLSRAEDTVGSP